MTEKQLMDINTELSLNQMKNKTDHLIWDPFIKGVELQFRLLVVSLIFFMILLILLLFIPPQAHATELSGKASYYSRAGCLGCSKTFTMANGQVLDDSKLTIALTPATVRKYKLLNDYVGVINVKTRQSVIAKVTDTGGFSKYNRVADLGFAVKEAIGCGSICNVIIIW